MNSYNNSRSFDSIYAFGIKFIYVTVLDGYRMMVGLSILPPYTGAGSEDWCQRTSNAIYQNINYIEQYSPEYVLILSGRSYI